MTTMTTKHKRNLFAELKQSVEEINAYKAGKLTLQAYAINKKPCPQISADLPRKITTKIK